MEQSPLERLFGRHFENPQLALGRFRFYLSAAQLDFDLENNIIEMPPPQNPGFPKNLPSAIYYHIPGTCFGSVKNKGAPNQLYGTDGVGLNFGCPIRLAHAFDVLFSLSANDRVAPLAELKSHKNHFACVEEILWTTPWKEQTGLTRGGVLAVNISANTSKDVDWFFISKHLPIFLEVKFRQTDWMRQADGEKGRIREGFFNDIGSKLPKDTSAFQRCVAAITGYAEPESTFYRGCKGKLLSTPGLNAVLYRSLLGPIYVCGLNPTIVKELADRVREPRARAYPAFYGINFNRQHQVQRFSSWVPSESRDSSRLHVAVIPRPVPVFNPKYPQRSKVTWNGVGKPIFEEVLPFL